MRAELQLDRLQRWMLEVITRPGTVDDALRSEPARRAIAPSRLADMILPSPSLTAAQRIGIYHDMYLARMVEALEFDYPGVARLLGHRRFHRLVEEYVAAHPSRSYTLNRLGDHLPEHIAAASWLPRRAMAADLARLELAITLVFDAPHEETPAGDTLASVPAEAWPGARFRTIGAMRLLRLDYPVDDYLHSLKGEAPLDPPRRRERRHVLVFRSDLAVRQVAMERREWMLLSALRDGLTLAEAIGGIARLRPALSETEVFAWFRNWGRMGLFAAVETGGR